MLRFRIVLVTLLLALPLVSSAQSDDSDLEAQFMDDEFAETPTTTTRPPAAPPAAAPAPTAPAVAAPTTTQPPAPPVEAFPEPEITEPVISDERPEPEPAPFVEPEGAFTDTPKVEEPIPPPEIQAEPIPEPPMEEPVADTPPEHEEAVAVGDDPDLEKEARFHRIYKMFNEQPTPAEQWNTALGKATQSTYSVQKGDNLWSLSQTLFADPNFWPKIWSLNTGMIENPHQVLPGQVIQFVPGTMGEAPGLAVTEGGAAATTAQTPAAPIVPNEPEVIPVLPNGELDFSKVTVQESKKKSNPVATPPRSLPQWRYRGEEEKAPLILELTQGRRNYGSPQMVLPYFTSEGELPAFGEIVGTEGGFVSATDYQYVTVKMSEALSEKLATAVKNTDKVTIGKAGPKANVIQVQGEVEILEVVNSREGLHRAIVKRSVAPVEVGAKLIAGPMPTYNMKEDGDVMNLEGQIVGGYSYSGKLFGTDSIVYFNRGSRQGASPGQIINIYKTVPARVMNSRVLENELLIGKVKVLRTSENFLTGVVIHSSEDMRVGDSGIRQAVTR